MVLYVLGCERSMKRRTGNSSYWGFVKDPLYGYIRLTDVERHVIDTVPVQRLRRIRQLSGAEYVYPAANHTRFEHALGTMYLAGVLAETLPTDLSRDDIEELKIAALLHDVGHGPFSHIFDQFLIKHYGKTHEDFATWIINSSSIKEALQDEGFNPSDLGKLCVGKLHDRQKPFLDQIISSTVDVDKMDFIPRDSYHTGAGYGQADVFRLIYTMGVFDGNLAVGVTALPTLETFLLARLESFRAIYFHRASRAVQIMLVRALELAKDEIGVIDKSPDEYLGLDDFVVWSKLKTSKDSKSILQDIERRRLIKCAFEKTFFTKDETITSLFTNEPVRHQIETEIARKANVDPSKVIIDVPSLPSVPYSHSIGSEPMDVPIFDESRTRNGTSKKLADISRVIDVLRVIMNIIRIYTEEQYRDKVGRSAREVLGNLPVETKISY
jgi:hypothetical protein